MSPSTLPASALVLSPLKAASFLLGGIALAIVITGCSPAEPKKNEPEQQASSSATAASALSPQENSSITTAPALGSGGNEASDGSILYVSTEQGEDVDCSKIIGMSGQCDYQTIQYKGNSGDDAGRHFDAVGLTVFVIEGGEMSKQAYVDYLLKLYGNPPEKKVFSGKNFYQYAEGSPAMRAEEPGEADEGMFWTSGKKFILIHHNGIDGDTAEGEKSQMYLSLLLEKYMKIYPSDL